MDEIKALEALTPPSKPRPHIWMGGILQIVVTRACDLSCIGCSQGSQLGGKPSMMTPDQFEQACNSLHGYPHVVGIFGGNAAISPHFETICEIFKSKFQFEQRGLWCNNPMGKGGFMRSTFDPSHSNLNVHLSRAAFDAFWNEWPECRPYLKGLDPSWPEAQEIRDLHQRANRIGDSRHGPPMVAMMDLDKLPGDIDNTVENRWSLISTCDISRNWSAACGVVRGQVRGFFCEIAYAQSALHEANPDYPDTGLDVTQLHGGKLWWQLGMDSFADQARKHCHECGIPLRGYGDLAVAGTVEQVSPTHADIFKLKNKSRRVELVTRLEQLGDKHLPRSTDYIQNSSLPVLQ